MQKQLKETAIYKPTKAVTVTVHNKPVTIESTGEIFFEQVVTFKIQNGLGSDKLQFRGEDDLRQFLDEIVLEDPQQKLPL